MENIVNQINKLKKEKNAIILAHYYQEAEVQHIADYVGDSFGLAKMAMETEKDMIVFCGVHFMAESAKILNPGKKVLLPAIDAGCPMADMVTAEDVIRLKAENPDAATVCYVNSSAEVKAECEISCTSSNAVKVVASLPNKKIIFVPDQNLASFVAKQLPDKEFVPFQGFCPTHHKITPQDVIKIKELYPNAPVLVHPECTAEVVALSDFAGSTAQIINYALKHQEKEYIIGTEKGVIDYLNDQDQSKKYHLMSHRMVCVNMKKTTLKHILNVLETENNEIKMSQEDIGQSYSCLSRMMGIS